MRLNISYICGSSNILPFLSKKYISFFVGSFYKSNTSVIFPVSHRLVKNAPLGGGKVIGYLIWNDRFGPPPLRKRSYRAFTAAIANIDIYSKGVLTSRFISINFVVLIGWTDDKRNLCMVKKVTFLAKNFYANFFYTKTFAFFTPIFLILIFLHQFLQHKFWFFYINFLH